MPDTLTTAERSERMSRIRGKDTKLDSLYPIANAAHSTGIPGSVSAMRLQGDRP
jgi:G:T-mismatch repair DNA endonuclease (very short patch repair protein)